MNKLALTAAFASLISMSSAQAAELHDWSGVYGGLSAGSTKSKSVWTGVDTSDSFPDANIDETISDTSGDFGGFLGFNQQSGNVVYGVEGAFSMFKSDESVLLDGSEGLDLTSETKNLGSIRARLGYATGNALVYVTGGAAFSSSTQTWDDDGFDGGDDLDPVDMKMDTGWVAGAGIEYAVTEAISIRAEGLYYDFGSQSGVTDGEDDTFKVKQTATSARVGIAYHF